MMPVTRNKKKIPCFKNKSQNAEIGSFDEVKLNNASKMGMSFKSSNSDIVDVEYAYLGDANYRLVPKNEGEATIRSEERRVGKECRSRWSPYH